MEIAHIMPTETTFNEFGRDRGFSLLELMIVLVISSIIIMGTYAAYSVQSKSYSTQREISKIQQDLRGALYMMEFDVLNAGRDPSLSNRYGITDIRYYDYQAGALDNVMASTPFVLPAAANSPIYFGSFPVIEFTSLRRDTNGDRIGDAPVTIRYQVYDFDNDGRLDFGRRQTFGMTLAPELNSPPVLVAEGVVAVGYAFAYNPAPSGKYEMARTAPPMALPTGELIEVGNVIWAVDSNGDGRLDTNIDTDGDGDITVADDTDDSGVIDAADMGPGMPASVDTRNVVAVKVWLMLQSKQPTPENTIDRKRYVVGNRVIPPETQPFFNDHFKRRVETVTLSLRNYKKS